MNLASTKTPAIKQLRQHFLLAFGGLCVVVVAVTAGAVTGRPSGGVAMVSEAPSADLTRFHPVSDDWQTIYYIVATQGIGDQILSAEAEQQSLILENRSELPHRTIHVLVVDSPERESNLMAMLADALPNTTSFVDLRPPAPSINTSDAGVFADVMPAPGIERQTYPYVSCSELPEGLLALPPYMLETLCR